MKPRMVTVTSSKMDSEVQKAGRVALYGVYFAFNKADLNPESEPTLAEMSKLATPDPPGVEHR
jgi:OOP family OmpA-OmpF porin